MGAETYGVAVKDGHIGTPGILMQEDAGGDGPEFDLVADHRTSVRELFHGFAADALRVDDDRRVIAYVAEHFCGFERFRFPDRFPRGGELPIDVRDIEDLGITDAQFPDAEPQEFFRKLGSHAAATGNADHFAPEPFLFFSRDPSD